MCAIAALAVAALLGLASARGAQAQFAVLPSPLSAAQLRASEAETPLAYRSDGARHLYESYPMRIHRGKLPPLMYAVAIIETEIDEGGQVLEVSVTREPAGAKEVSAWIVQMIRKASPFPPAPRLGRVIYTDIWLVDKEGAFQLDTLTEGQ
jgi:hypothetical protein